MDTYSGDIRPASLDLTCVDAHPDFEVERAHLIPHELNTAKGPARTLEHCDDIAGGCPVAALAPEIPRRPKKVRERLLQAIGDYVRRLRPYVPGRDDEERQRNAIAILSGMAGTLTIARAFSSVEDRARILEAARMLFLRALPQST